MNQPFATLIRRSASHSSLASRPASIAGLVLLLGHVACSSSDAHSSANPSAGAPNAAGGSSAGGSPSAGGSSGNSSSAGNSGGDPSRAGSAGMITVGGATGVAGAAAAGSGGMGGGAGSAAQGGGAGSGNGGSGSAGLGGSSLCEGSKYAICESFEGTAAGATPPSGWTIASSNYGPGSIAIAEDQAARGGRSLKITLPNAATSTEKFIQKGALGALANGHYGRVFYRILEPTTTAFVHWDLIVGVGSFNGANRRVRWGVTGTGIGDASSNWAWIYNIEQGDRGAEDRTLHPQLSKWQCLEWRWAGGSAQQLRFYLDGKESTQFHVDGKLPDGNSADIPIFSNLNFGISSFHELNMPLAIWIDEIAVDAERIGCGN